jgi:hypothetical protein
MIENIVNSEETLERKTMSSLIDSYSSSGYGYNSYK